MISSTCEGKIVNAIVCKSFVSNDTIGAIRDKEHRNRMQDDLVREFAELSKFFKVCPIVNFVESGNSKSAVHKTSAGTLGFLAADDYSLLQQFEDELKSKWNQFKSNADKQHGLRPQDLFDSEKIKILVNGFPLTEKASMVGNPWYFQFPQDVYQLYGADANTEVQINPRLRAESGNDYEILIRNDCAGKILPSNLSLSSGNMHVLGTSAFIGNNVLREGYDYKGAVNDTHRKEILNRLMAIGCNEKSTLEEIEYRIQTILGVEHIIWVGSSSKVDLAQHDGEALMYRGNEVYADTGWQPLYHLDLFFHPFKLSNVNGKKVLTYFISEASKKWQNPDDLVKYPDFARMVETLDAHMRTTEQYVNKQLLELGIESEAIRIPLYVSAADDGNFKAIFAFLNGLMEADRYFMPVYHRKKADVELENYHAALNQAVKKLESKMGKQTVVQLFSEYYGLDNALHCQVFVTKRSAVQ